MMVMMMMWLMIRILRFIWRFWIRSTYFQSGNANRRKFFEDDLHNLDHIVQWNNLLLTIFFMVVVFLIVVKESIGFSFLGVKELVQIVKISKVQTRLLSPGLLGLILKDAVQIIVWIGSDTE